MFLLCTARKVVAVAHRQHAAVARARGSHSATKILPLKVPYGPLQGIRNPTVRKTILTTSEGGLVPHMAPQRPGKGRRLITKSHCQIPSTLGLCCHNLGLDLTSEPYDLNTND